VLIGAHVSIAGGLVHAVERGVERESDAIQIFNQSSRMWRPNTYGDDDVAEFREALEGSRIDSVTIHAVYLINCASAEKEIRSKSLTALKGALELGDRIGALGVVLHPGARKGRDYDESMAAVGDALREALEETDRCPILLEDTAGAGGTLGRDFGELARMIELGGGGDRLGLCLDCCHMLASGFEVRRRDALAAVVDDLEATIGLDRLRVLHINDSKTPLGSNRDRHALLGEGELGERGLRVFLSEPRFEGLPALLETGPDGAGPDVGQVRIAKRLRREGLANRRRSRRRR
jgi:deoxyribonuclease-4